MEVMFSKAGWKRISTCTTLTLHPAQPENKDQENNTNTEGMWFSWGHDVTSSVQNLFFLKSNNGNAGFCRVKEWMSKDSKVPSSWSSQSQPADSAAWRSLSHQGEFNQEPSFQNSGSFLLQGVPLWERERSVDDRGGRRRGQRWGRWGGEWKELGDGVVVRWRLKKKKGG